MQGIGDKVWRKFISHRRKKFSRYFCPQRDNTSFDSYSDPVLIFLEYDCSSGSIVIVCRGISRWFYFSWECAEIQFIDKVCIATELWHNLGNIRLTRNVPLIFL